MVRLRPDSICQNERMSCGGAGSDEGAAGTIDAVHAAVNQGRGGRGNTLRQLDLHRLPAGFRPLAEQAARAMHACRVWAHSVLWRDNNLVMAYLMLVM